MGNHLFVLILSFFMTQPINPIIITNPSSNLNIFLNFFTNHDTFYLSIYGLSRILVKDCYYQMYDMNFLSFLLLNFDKQT